MAIVTYIVRLKDQTGSKLTEFVGRGRSIGIPGGLRSISYWKRLQTPGAFTISIDGLDERIAFLDLDLSGTLDTQVEFWRRDILGGPSYTSWLAGLPVYQKDTSLPGWYKDFEGFHRSMEMNQDNEGRDTFVSRGSGYNVLLAAETIRYPVGSSEASKSGASETVLKEFVDENIGPSATAPPRDRSGVMPGLTIEADGGNGSTWEGDRANKNLLDVTQEISDFEPIDYLIVGTGAATFEFKTGFPQWGDDKTLGNGFGNPPVVFSSEYGNATNIKYRYSRLNEVNTVDVAGTGKAGDRVIQSVQNGLQTDSPWNTRAVVRDARREWDTTILTNIGTETLNDQRLRRIFTFDVIQTAGSRYGRDWDMGDLVTLIYRGRQINQKIVGVRVSVNNNGEEVIRPEMEDIL